MAVAEETDRRGRKRRGNQDPLEARVATFVRAQRMVVAGDRLLVAVSGGPDSVALLSMLSRWRKVWRLDLRAVHFNHGLRGLESDEDARFVTDLCAELDVALEVVPLDLTDGMRNHKAGSLQERARHARYAALERMTRKTGAKRIAVGHTADDQAETVMMWMLRGAGTTGLGGIPPMRDAWVVRPLLHTSREDVLAYLKRRRLGFRFDSTNASDRYLRNRIRHHLMPVLQRFNPSIVTVLARQADLVRDDDRCLDFMAGQWEAQELSADEDEIVFLRSRFLDLPVALQRRIARRIIREVTGRRQGPSRSLVDWMVRQIIEGPSGAVGTMGQALVIREYDRIRVVRNASTSATAWEGHEGALAVSIPSTVTWVPSGHRLDFSMRETRDDPMRPGMAAFDADQFTGPLLIRSWLPGDSFCPCGMKGRRKKLQDFFSDLKVPRATRRRIPLIVAPEGILWVGGYRTDHRFRVRASTRHILVIQMSPQDS